MMLTIPTHGRSPSLQRGPSLQHGVTLIELMVAMVLGLLVAGGIITVFSSTSSSSKAQAQLSRLQEEGRFAITRLGGDLRMANGQYCNNSGGVASAASNGTLLDQLRAPRVYAKALIGPVGAISGALADVTTPWGNPYPAAPTAPYPMPAFLYMRGYDCTLTGCTPVDPHDSIPSIPAMGTAFGDRVKGTDVVTVRYVNSDAGWTIAPVGSSTGSTITTTSSGGVDSLASVTINPLPGEPPATDFGAGDLAMLADCSSAQIFALSSVGSGVLTVDTAASVNLTTTPPPVPNPQSAPKLFDVNRDFRTVTYYLRVVSVNNDTKAPFTGALMRRVNGGTGGVGSSEDELVRGVERMDFRYGVEDADGNTSFLAAADVDSAANCPPREPEALTPATGCLWRGVKSIEVSLLMDGQVPLYTLSADNLKYAYSADANPGLLAPSGHAIKPSDQGFPDQLLRREFSALVAVRNFNP